MTPPLSPPLLSELPVALEWAGLGAVALGGALVAALSLHGLHRLQLVAALWAHKAPVEAGAWPSDLPRITVQLPIFNERDVVERLIDAACALDWPADRLEIQVLDDSTDDCAARAARAVARQAAAGAPIRLLRRADRAGFKAGALRAGLAEAKGELIAIFDADFVPPPGCLRALAAPLADPRVGMAQARWGHLNAEASLLTAAQALMLDAHFIVEHGARYRSGRFFNFNGTAGLWRRAAIEQAGGWSADTITEDLDLSYRAQLRGWRFVYIDPLVIPAELPASMGAFLGQQARWAAGTTQVAKKLLWRLLSAPLPLGVRAEAAAHLLGPLAWPLTAALSLLLGPAALLRAGLGLGATAFDGLAFGLSFCALSAFYLTAARRRGGPLRLRLLPAVMALGVGMSLRQAAAVLGALRPSAGVFRRTPKTGATDRAAGGASYARAEALRWPELGVAALNLGCALALLAEGRFSTIPFLTLFSAGSLFVGLGGGRGARATEATPSCASTGPEAVADCAP